MVSVELFAQGGMVDINNDEYNQAVERLIRFPVDTRSVIPVISVHSGDIFNMVLQS